MYYTISDQFLPSLKGTFFFEPSFRRVSVVQLPASLRFHYLVAYLSSAIDWLPLQCAILLLGRLNMCCRQAVCRFLNLCLFLFASQLVRGNENEIKLKTYVSIRVHV